ncbi:MAG: beta strand repeat-containing protein [Aquabacterium sp.]
MRLTDSNPVFSLSAAQVAANIDVLRSIGSPFTIVLTDGGTPTITLPVWTTSADAYNEVLKSITTPFNLTLAGPLRANSLATIVANAERSTLGDNPVAANPIAPLGTLNTTQLPSGLKILDLQSRLSGYLETLQLAALAGKIASITMRDGGLQVLSLTPAEVTSNTAALPLFSPNFQLSQVISAAQAAAPTLDGRFANFTVADSVANILANVDAIDALMRQGRLGRLRFTEATPNLTMTADQLGRAALILSQASENTLVIHLSDAGTPTVTIAGNVLSVSNVRANVLTQVVGNYNLVVSGNISVGRAGTILTENTKVLASLTSVRIGDFVGNLNTTTNLATLTSLTNSGKLTGIDVLSSGVQQMGLSAGQISANSAALALITTPVVLGTSAPSFVTLSAAAFQAQLVSLEAQVRARTLDLIALVESDVIFSLSAATLGANIDAFGVLDTGTLSYEINLTDPGTPNFALAPWQVTNANLQVLASIVSVGSYTVSVTGALSASQAAALGNSGQTAKLAGGVAMVDFLVNWTSNLSGLRTLQAAGKLTSTTLLDVGPVRISLDAAAIALNAGLLSTIVSSTTLSQIVTAAAAGSTALTGSVDSLTVTDSSANIIANLASLQNLAVKGTLVAINGLAGAINLSAAQVAANAQALLRAGTGYTITLSDGGTPTITLQNWQIGTDIATLLGRITSPYTLAINGSIRPNRAATLVSAGATIYNHLAAGALTVRETPATLRGSLPQLLTLANAGKIGSIDTRGGRPIFSLTEAEAITYAPVLALINTPYTRSLIVTVAQLATATLPTGFLGFTVVDSVANVLAGIAQIQAVAVTGKLDRVDYTDAAPRIVTSAAALSANAAAFAAQDIDGYPVELTDAGTPTVTVPAHLLGGFFFRNATLDAITGPWSLQVNGRVSVGTVTAIVAENNNVKARLAGKLDVAGFSFEIAPDIDYLLALHQAGKLNTLDILDTNAATFTLTIARVAALEGVFGLTTDPYILKTETGTTARTATADLARVIDTAFDVNHAIDLRDMAFSPAGLSFVYSAGSLQVLRNGAPQGTAAVTAAPGVTYDNTSFYVAPDGAAGTRIKAIDATIGALAVTNTTTSTSFATGGTFFDGAIGYLQRQFINPTGGSVAVGANIPNVFLHGGGLRGGNALQVLSGRNVIDGGTGSNFLVGGLGSGPDNADTFFLDGRGGGVSWGTVVNFQAGDAVTFWGWKDGITTFDWFADAGAPGFQGATIHARLNGGSGDYDASITFTGIDLATAQSWTILTGTTGGLNTYAYIQAT